LVNKPATCSTAKKLAEALQFSTRAWQIARKYEVALAERVRDEMAAKVTWQDVKRAANRIYGVWN